MCSVTLRANKKVSDNKFVAAENLLCWIYFANKIYVEKGVRSDEALPS